MTSSLSTRAATSKTLCAHDSDAVDGTRPSPRLNSPRIGRSSRTTESSGGTGFTVGRGYHVLSRGRQPHAMRTIGFVEAGLWCCSPASVDRLWSPETTAKRAACRPVPTATSWRRRRGSVVSIQRHHLGANAIRQLADWHDRRSRRSSSTANTVPLTSLTLTVTGTTRPTRCRLQPKPLP